MKIHEYQAKELFKQFNIPVSKGYVADSVQQAVENAKKIGGNMWVVKAQIHAGGRGKAGGVKLAKSFEELEKYSKEILGKTLVTHQTGPEGKVVKKIYIVEAIDIKKEFYLAILLDRTLEIPVIIASSEGGMEIEKVAEESPEKIIKRPIEPLVGITPFYIRELANALGFDKKQTKEFSKFLVNLYKMYLEKDASLIEINPLVLKDDDKFDALDAKVTFDDNALYRHPEISELRDFDEEEPTETEASEFGLNYVKLDGNVGCMVNGAGLAMSTMDIIKHEGGEPANFLDVGGGANPKTVAKGFEIILKDPNVKSIFVNIFGGIVRCDRIANGIIEATKITKVNVPVIVRLDGTNAEEAMILLKNTNIDNIIPAETLHDGAIKAVKAAKGELS
jgi:succinyl-CoA synthetase beta subunit